MSGNVMEVNSCRGSQERVGFERKMKDVELMGRREQEDTCWTGLGDEMVGRVWGKRS